MKKKSYLKEKNLFFEFVCQPYFKNDIYELMAQIDNLMQHPKKIFKNTLNDTTTVVLVEFKDKYYVIKRYNFKSILHTIKLQFRKSHGFKSFHFANRLNKLGIPCVKPVAVIQKKWFCLRGMSYFISHFEEGVPASQYFNDDSTEKNSWPLTILFMKLMTNNIKINFIYHGDYQFGNILIRDKRPILLDFDRIRIVKNANKFGRLHQKDIRNFRRHLQTNPSAANEFNQFFEPLSEKKVIE